MSLHSRGDITGVVAEREAEILRDVSVRLLHDIWSSDSVTKGNLQGVQASCHINILCELFLFLSCGAASNVFLKKVMTSHNQSYWPRCILWCHHSAPSFNQFTFWVQVDVCAKYEDVSSRCSRMGWKDGQPAIRPAQRRDALFSFRATAKAVSLHHSTSESRCLLAFQATD